MKILLVEDNPLTAKGLTYLLEREHYDVQAASSMDAACTTLAELGQGFDLVLLDVSLPDGDGFKVADFIKTHYAKLPIIFLTARDSSEDVVRGLELGADDYIAKPFHNRELLLRIKNVLGRRNTAAEILSHGALAINLTTGTAEVNHKPIDLTTLERKLLTCLLENAKQVVTRERLADEIYAMSGKIVNDNTISVYMKRLREKLGRPELIKTVKNLGYRLGEGAK